MTKNALLAGSLSNDLFRVASLAQRGSFTGASRFLGEAKRWSRDLEKLSEAGYIRKIAHEISSQENTTICEAVAERYLMYGVLLQNYVVHTM